MLSGWPAGALVLLFCATVRANYNCAAAGRGCLNGGVCKDSVELGPTNPGSSGNGWPSSSRPQECVCPAPYAGFDCSYTIRECKDQPCHNGGTCSPATCMPNGSPDAFPDYINYDCFTCACPTGFTGSPAYQALGIAARAGGVCDWPVACGPNTCQNGGVCTDNYVSGQPVNATCACPNGFFGADCSQPFNCSLPQFACQNAATCLSDGSCQCAQSIQGGLRCEIAPFCDNPNACPAGATCVPTGPGTGQCTLPSWCSSHTCAHGGSCSDTGNGEGECACVEPFDGSQGCNATLFCSSLNGGSPCQNGGTCANQIPTARGGQGTCTCPEGFVGDLCEMRLPGCGRQTVGCAPHGTCLCTDKTSCERSDHPWYATNCRCQSQTGGLNYFDCRCNSTAISKCPGTVGPASGQNVDMVCQNGGTCAEWGDEPYCMCRPGFWGDKCQNYDNPCLNYPCQNGGRCAVVGETADPKLTDRYWGYFCHCRWPYYGEFCELTSPGPADVCTNNRCLNGATCTVRPYDDVGNFVQKIGDASPFAPPYLCNCAAGFVGVYCEQTVETCTGTGAGASGNPCQNGGFCKQTSSGISCTCKCGYAGDRCEVTATNFDAESAANFASNGAGGVGYALDFCSTNPCRNDGACHPTVDGQGFVCHCKAGWAGTYCQVLVRSAATAAAATSPLVAAVVALAVALAARRV